MSALQRLKERKLVQWAVAYLAGAWLVLEVFQSLQEGLGWSPRLYAVLVGVLAVGLVVTLVLAWYHGEQGRQRVSGPELLIIGGILLVAALLFPVVFGSDRPGGAQEAAAPADSTSAPAPSSRPAVAVLPFRNVSGLAEDEPFVGGIHDEVLTQLNKIRSLDNKSAQSVLAYRDSDKTLPVIAEELGVQYLVQGSVRRVGETIRMRIDLFDATADSLLWQEQYEERRTVEDMLELQRRIAIEVATQAGAEVLPGERTQLAVDPPEDWRTYELYLEGVSHFREAALAFGDNRQLLLRAREVLGEAIAADPEWAPPRAALGRVYHFLAANGVEPSLNFPRSLEALDRAIALDSLHAPAWASLGFVRHNWARDFEGAEEAYERAEELGWPSRWGYAILLLSWGRYAEAIDAFRTAVSFNRSASIVWQLAWALLCAGEYGAAIEQLERLEARVGATPQASAFLGYAYLKLGDPERGLAEISGIGVIDADKALVYALADSTERAKELLAGVQEDANDWSLSSTVAAATLVLEGRERALGYLERAVDQEPLGLLHVQCLEEVRSLEGDPRYEAVLDRVGFPPRER